MSEVRVKNIGDRMLVSVDNADASFYDKDKSIWLAENKSIILQYLTQQTNDDGVLIDDFKYETVLDQAPEDFIEPKESSVIDLLLLLNDILGNEGTGNAPQNVIYINKESDFKQVGGFNIIEDGYTYIVGVSNLELSMPIDISEISSIASLKLSTNIITYTGIVAFLQGIFSGAFALTDGVIFNSNIATIYDIGGSGVLVGNAIASRNISFLNFAGIGVMDSLGSMTFTSEQYSNCGTGIVLKDIPVLNLSGLALTNTVTSNSPKIVLDGTISTATITGNLPLLQAGESFIQISKNIVVNSEISVVGNSFSNALGGEFFASAITGSISSFADNGSGGTTVTTAAPHGLTIEQKIEITGTTNYNSIFQMSSVTTTTYDINTAFVGDDGTGNYDTGDSGDFLDNNSFDFENNGDQINSNEIGKMEQLNSILVTISGSDTPVQIIGSPGDWSGIIDRRFAFEQDGDGTITYIGAKSLPFTFQITSTTNPSGGTDTITTYVAVNGILSGLSGTTETNNSGFVGIMGVLSTMLNTGDIISFWTENNNDSSNITVEFTKVSIFSI